MEPPLLAAFPYGFALFGKRAGAFQIILGAIEAIDGFKLPAGNPVHGILKFRILGVADDFLDRRMNCLLYTSDAADE